MSPIFISNQITLIQIGKILIMKKKVLFILIISAMTYGKCDRVDLQIKRQNYLGKTLKIDGIFYNEPHKAHFFLYRNGVFFDGGISFNGSINELLKFYSQNENYITAYELPYRWGVFKVNENIIRIEKWVSSDTFGMYTSTSFSGEIINDTTLLINYPTNIIGKDTFYFYQFSQKPDSTNNFIN